MVNKYDLARKIFNEMKPDEVLEYTCTAINSLGEHEEDFNLAYNSTRKTIKLFIIETLIVNEIDNGFRSTETGELMDNIQSIQYGMIK